MAHDNYLSYYRGELQALYGHHEWAIFVSKHYEGQATALYRFNLDSLRLYQEELPCGATALTGHTKKNNVWLAAENGTIYQASIASGKPKALKKLPVFEQPVLAMACLSTQSLLVLQANCLTVIDSEQQSIQQQIELPLSDSASVIAVDPTGSYIALGMQSGEVAVYEYREQQLHFSAKADLHQGKVTALQFEPNALRFFSAGEDKKLLTTHALGELEALDRGKKKNHTGVIAAIVCAEKRFFTVASDKTAKSWAYEGGQPVSFQHNLHKAIDAELVTIKDSRYLLTINSDNSLRMVGIDADERFTHLRFITRDGYAWAKHELQQSDPVVREKAVRFLFDFDDKKSIDMVQKRLAHEPDKATRELMVTLATKAKHPQAIALLEHALCDHKHASIRRLAFAALDKKSKPSSLSAPHDLRYLSLVLGHSYDDVGTLALSKLATLAKKQARAEQLLLGALNHQSSRLREFALSELETVYRNNDPKAGLQALQSKHADLQRAAMIRLFQRDLLHLVEVKRAIALLQDHQNAVVRHTAFLVSILGQDRLTQVLKTREKDLARQLQELEDFELLADQQSGKKGTKSKSTLVKKIKKQVAKIQPASLDKLSHNDYVPLLQGMSSGYADICFTASFALAVLEDSRAFGVLLLLSHDRDVDIRVGVCKAFAWLKQPDSIEILQNLLHDSNAAVRDAAFSALLKVQQQPLTLAAVGLAVQHNDIQLRALTTLLDVIHETSDANSAIKDDALTLLKTALNSPFTPIRQETFKACFNRSLGGDTLQTLQLLLQSHYEDIHQEVMNELTAASQVKQPATWVLPLLKQLLLNNTFATIRRQAFELGIQQKKKFEPVVILQAALASEFVDTRERVLQRLMQQPVKENNQSLLLPLLNDSDRALRHQALAALVAQQRVAVISGSESEVNNHAMHDVLNHALDSRYEDIRVAAAKASATLGNPQAYSILLSLATQPEPEKAEDKKRWQEAVVNALQGFAILGDNRAFAVVVEFLPHKHKTIVKAATEALPMLNISEADQRQVLVDLLKHDQSPIRAAASLALAYALPPQDNEQDQQQHKTTVLTALADSKVERTLSRTQLLAAQTCLADIAPQRLQRFVVGTQHRLSSQFILMAHELVQYPHRPTLSLQCLATEEPRLQRIAADLLSRYHQPEQCWQYMVDWLNHSAGKESLHWAFTIEMLQQYSAIVVHATPFIKARFIHVLELWDQRASMEQWQVTMNAFMARFQTDVPVYTPAKANKTINVTDQQIRQWRELAFGAYLGRIRSVDGDDELNQRLHAASLRGLRYLATQDEALKQSVESCLLTLLNHQNLLIRQTAFDDLQALNMDLEQLGNAATASPQSDIAKQGLKLLVDHYPVKKSLNLLHSLLKTGDEVLAVEAYRLLLDEEGLLKTAPSALQSYTVSLRHECLAALAKQYEDTACQQLLLTAVDNDHFEVAMKAAGILARHQHDAIFAKLKLLLTQSNEEKQQKTIVGVLGQLKTPEVAVFLTDYLQQQKTARDLPLTIIYRIIANYRHVAVADTLLTRFIAHEKEQTLLFRCLMVISGYDQRIDGAVYNRDEDESDTPPTWLDQQYPRHHQLVVDLFTTLLQCKQSKRAEELLPLLSWMPADIPDAALLKAVPIVEQAFLVQLTHVIAWRYYQRNRSTLLANGLLKLLTHTEADIQFLAAEGLAKGGQTQGKAVLLSSIEYLDNIDYRRRAVLALGESADPQVLETLLKLAKDKEHALQEVAIEAIGHMGANDRDEQLFKLLRHALRDANDYSDMVIHALNGLRFLNTLSAWQLIADVIKRDYFYYRDHAIKCLRYWDSDHSRALLLDIIQHSDDEDDVEVALKVAKQFWKPSKTSVNAVDFALLKGHCAFLDDQLVTRICDYASVSELFALLTAKFGIDDRRYADDDELKEHQQLLARLRHALLQRESIAEQDVVEQLNAEKRVSQSVAVQLLIRQPNLQSATKTRLSQVLQQTYHQWLTLHTDLLQAAQHDKKQLAVFEELQELLKLLLWCSVSQQIAASSPTLLAILQQTDGAQVKAHIVLQETLLTVLLSQSPTKSPFVSSEQRAAIAALLTSPVLTLRSLANQILSQQTDQYNTDLSWHYVVNKPQSTQGDVFISQIQQAATLDAEQALALPVLIARGDSQTLMTIADNASYEETVRIGAIEALGRFADQKVEEKLNSIRENNEDEDISKAAYRALRRSQRARSKQHISSK